MSQAETHLHRLLVGLGFSDDYLPPYNVAINALDLIGLIGFDRTPAHQKDLIWLCNQVAKIGQKERETLECRDNFRACAAVGERGMSSAYKSAKECGCCGFFDRLFTNPETGNSYWIGFNYGH